VEEHIRVCGLRQRPVVECGDLLVEARADPRYLRLADPGAGAERFHEIVELTGLDTVHVRLHHDYQQCLIDPVVPFQQ